VDPDGSALILLSCIQIETDQNSQVNLVFPPFKKASLPSFHRYVIRPIFSFKNSTFLLLWPTFLRSCGSGSALILLSWIQIRVGNGIQIQEHWNWPKLTSKPGFPPFKKACEPSFQRYVFRPITYFKYIFHVKILLFVDLKSDQDPYPDPLRFCSLDLDPDPHWDEKLDRNPDPHWNKNGSKILLFNLFLLYSSVLFPWNTPQSNFSHHRVIEQEMTCRIEGISVYTTTFLRQCKIQKYKPLSKRESGIKDRKINY
jgi:hypothetical protein